MSDTRYVNGWWIIIALFGPFIVAGFLLRDDLLELVNAQLCYTAKLTIEFGNSCIVMEGCGLTLQELSERVYAEQQARRYCKTPE